MIFNSSSYNLKNSLVISKSINIVSYKNTKINFNKNDDMIKIRANNVNITGLTLNHNGEGESSGDSLSTIFASGSYKKIDIKNTKISIKNSYCTGVYIEKWIGSFINSSIKTNGNYYSRGILSRHWKGNLANNVISTKGDGSYGIYIKNKWIGNALNNRIFTYGRGATAISSENWQGKINNNRIYTYGSLYSDGINLKNSKGSIYKNVVKSKSYYAIRVSDNVKVTSSSLSSRKDLEKIYRYRPDLCIVGDIVKNKTTYSFKVKNIGSLSAKSCYIGIKVDKFLQKIKINSTKSFEVIDIKIDLPKKYATKKYVKTIKLDYYNKIKEISKTNNIHKFKY